MAKPKRKPQQSKPQPETKKSNANHPIYGCMLALVLIIFAGMCIFMTPEFQQASDDSQTGVAIAQMTFDARPTQTSTYTRTPIPSKTPVPSKTSTFTRTATSIPNTATPTRDIPTEVVLPTLTNTPRPTTVRPTIIKVPTISPPRTAVPTPTSTPAPERFAVTPMSRVTWYVQMAEARLRSCPTRECEILETLYLGNEVVITGSVDGEVVSGSTLWYRVENGARIAYVHSSLVGGSQPSQQVNQTTIPMSTPIPAAASPFGCNGIDDLNCSDFRAIGQNANAHLAQCGDEDNLDGEGDGRACER